MDLEIKSKYFHMVLFDIYNKAWVWKFMFPVVYIIGYLIIVDVIFPHSKDGVTC